MKSPALACLRKARLADYVTALDWSPDGTRLAVASADGRITLLASAGGGQLAQWPGHALSALALAWAPDGDLLASGGQDTRACLWRASGAAVPGVLRGGGRNWVERLAWSPDGGLLAVAAGRRLGTWDRQGVALGEYGPLEYTVSDLHWTAAGLFACGNGYLDRWYPPASSPSERRPCEGVPLTVAASPAGRWVVAGCQDASLHVWDLDTVGGELYMAGFTTKVCELAWSSDGRFLASSGGNAPILWDFADPGPAGRRPLVLPEHRAPVTALAFMPHTYLLASGSRDGEVTVRDPIGGDLLARERDPDGAPVAAIAWHPFRPRVAVGFGSGRLILGTPSRLFPGRPGDRLEEFPP